MCKPLLYTHFKAALQHNLTMTRNKHQSKTHQMTYYNEHHWDVYACRLTSCEGQKCINNMYVHVGN